MLYSEDPNQFDHDLFYTPELLGQECCTCFKILRFTDFEADHTYRNGRKPQCLLCQNSPRLSLAEHTSRLKELSFSSEAVKKQRHADQEEFRLEDEREGRKMHSSDLLLKLHKLIPSLYIQEGGIAGDLAIYQVADTPQVKWGGKNFNYLGFITFGELNEYSQYEFDEKRDVVLRESTRGWRTTLLRCLKAGLLTEEQCNRVFGQPSGRASTVWYKELHKLRHNPKISPETGQIALD